jgi:predicted Zn-dependent protease
MADYIRQTWAKSARLTGLERITVNSLEAGTATTRGNINGKTMDVRLLAIRGSGGSTFRMQFLSPTNMTSRLRDDFRRTTYSFRHMSARERRDLSPLRIRLYQVRRGDTVTRIANKMAVKKFAVERFMLLNGVSQTEPLKSGTTVKIISDR